MKFKAEQIAEILGGIIEGDAHAEVDKLSKIEEGIEGSLTFLSNPKYNNYLYTTAATIAIVNKDFELEKKINTTLIRVDDAYQAFSKLLEFYNEVKLNKQGIEHPSYISDSVSYGEGIYVGAFAYIGDNVKIGDYVKIYPNTFIGNNVVIGDNVTLFAGVKVYSETQIGKNCIIHAGTIVGSDGFGFSQDNKGVYSKIPQIGNVILEDDVEIGAASTIDRATLGHTIIRRGVKLDNQIHIAHNVEIGEDTVIAAQTGVAGSTKIGKQCVIGGQVGISGHLVIGDRVKIQAQSGIGKKVKDDEVLQGSPAFSYGDYNKSYVHFKNLPEIIKELNLLLKKNKV